MRRFIWNAERLALLRAAYEAGETSVKFGRNDTFVFRPQEAKRIIEEISADLAANTPRVYPENREGAEP